MKRGSVFAKEFEEKRLNELNKVHNVTKCAVCGKTWQGKLERTRELFRKHRDRHHPHMTQRTDHKRRGHGQMVISDKTLNENIAAVREDGGHRWDT